MISNYSNRVYEVSSRQAAKEIILTPGDGLTTDHRWETETPYLVDLMRGYLPVDGLSLYRILDYGCGIGRLSNALLQDYQDATVIGIDTSRHMRCLAIDYVKSDNFVVFSPKAADKIVSYHSCDFAIAVWVLQHCNDVESDLLRISKMLKYGGRLFVVNEEHRCIPSLEGRWVSDNISIRTVLQKYFSIKNEGRLDPNVVGRRAASGAFWGLYQTKGDA